MEHKGVRVTREADRWQHMIRYCRLRMWMRIERLPEDVLESVCSHLEVDDLQSLVVALGWRWPKTMPRSVRDRIVFDDATKCLTMQLQNEYAQAAGYLCAMSPMNRAFVSADWSVFSARPPCPLATYRWELLSAYGNRPTLSVVLNEAALRAQATRMISQRTACARLTLHTFFIEQTSHQMVMGAEYCHSTCWTSVPP
jgi:hypothetical protein